MTNESLEQRARSASSKIIEHLASLVMAPQTEDQFDADVLPRDFVMSAVQSVKHWADELCSVAAEYKSALESTRAQEVEPGALSALVTAANAVLAENPADDGMWTLEQAVRPFNATKPAECANGCPTNQACDYCQHAALSARTAPAEGDAVRGQCDYCGKTYGRVACCKARYEYLKHYGDDILPPATTAPVVGDGLRGRVDDVGYGGFATVSVDCTYFGEHTLSKGDTFTIYNDKASTARPAKAEPDPLLVKLQVLVDDLMDYSRSEQGKSEDRQWSEWVRDRHHGKSSGLATAASRLSAILDTARTVSRGESNG